MSTRQVALLAAGVLYLAVGALAFLAPGTFYDQLAAYAPDNHHFIRDVGTWNVGLGLAALLAAPRPDWHRPMLAVLAVQYALHTVSHVIDAGDTDPAWQSWLALVVFAIGTVVLAALASAAPARAGTPSGSPPGRSGRA